MSNERNVISVFDPHFHVWDLNVTKGKNVEGNPANTQSYHDPVMLFAPDEKKKYGVKRYEQDMDKMGSNFRHIGGVEIEAMSVCYPKISGWALADTFVGEGAWVAKNLGTSSRKYAFMASAALEDPHVGDVLQRLAQFPTCRGIRQILNFEPSYPRSPYDLMTSQQWVNGYKQLEKYGFAFDLQCNPWQLLTAAAIVRQCPNIPVIINHLGCPTVPDLQDHASVYWKGMRGLSQTSTCYLKISMLPAIDPEWSSNPVIIDAIHKLIEMFGIDRCFFASNFPVDNYPMEWEPKRLYIAFKEIASRYTIEQQQQLFAGNAMKAYKMLDAVKKSNL